LWAAVGVHPHDARTLDAAGRRELARLATHPRVVAVGETGLDYYRMLSPKEVQQEALRFHLDLAAEAGRPVILHERETRGDLLRVLTGRSGLAGAWHCFSADLPAAGAALDLGLYLGLAGPLAFPRSDSLRETAAKLPLDRILLETDSPYLAPPPHRGRRNEPAHVRVVAEMLARVRQMPPAEIARQTAENASRLFPGFGALSNGAVEKE
jgi:TatD DNase family protein